MLFSISVMIRLDDSLVGQLTSNDLEGSQLDSMIMMLIRALTPLQ